MSLSSVLEHAETVGYCIITLPSATHMTVLRVAQPWRFPRSSTSQNPIQFALMTYV